MRPRIYKDVTVPAENPAAAVKQLHEDLVAYRVKPRDVPKAILRLRELYHQLFAYDAAHFEAPVLSEPYEDAVDAKEAETMRALLYKVANYNLFTAVDDEFLQKTNFAEAQHIRDYLQFQHEAMTYATHVGAYLLQLNSEIRVKSVTRADGKQMEVVPPFYKSGLSPNAVIKLKELLENVALEVLHPIDTLILFNKVADVFYHIRESATRPPLTRQFYSKHLELLRSFSYIVHEPAHANEVEQENENHLVMDL